MATLVQIAILDIVFSLDSVITAVGMASHVPVMVLAIMIAVGVMMFAAKAIGDFGYASDHQDAGTFFPDPGGCRPNCRRGFDLHIPKGYIYFAMAFSLGVEMLNIRLRKSSQAAVKLHKSVNETANSSSLKKKAVQCTASFYLDNRKYRSTALD